MNTPRLIALVLTICAMLGFVGAISPQANASDPTSGYAVSGSLLKR